MALLTISKATEYERNWKADLQKENFKINAHKVEFFF